MLAILLILPGLFIFWYFFQPSKKVRNSENHQKPVVHTRSMGEPWFFPGALQQEPAPTPFGLCPNVWVDLELLETDDYKLKHPEQVALQLNLDKSKLLNVSRLSPRSPVTCSWAQRSYLHIPLDARSFVWANPIISESNGNQLYAAENDLICFLAYGGYVYFDRRNDIVKINGVKMGEDLDFCGPFAMDEDHSHVFEALKAAGRLNAVTLAGLKDHAKFFAWVLPGEFTDCPLGAFVYEYERPEHNRYIMLRLQDRDPDLPAQDLGIQLEFLYQQPYIASISENSPLRVCNVKRGDTILKWAENVITNWDSFLRVYHALMFDQAVTLVVRHAEQVPTEISYSFFRMKNNAWAEGHFQLMEQQQFPCPSSDSCSDLSRALSPSGPSSGGLPSPRQLSGDLPRSPGEHATNGPAGPPHLFSTRPPVMNFTMPILDAEASEPRKSRSYPEPPKSPSTSAVLGGRSVSISYVAPFETAVREDDTKLLYLRVAEVNPALFQIQFPRYTVRIPEGESFKVIEGRLSAWTTVNLGLEEHRWIVPSSNCFVFAYPPEGGPKGLTAGGVLALQRLLLNGAWLYFDADESTKDDDGDLLHVKVTQCMVILGTADDPIAASCGHAVTMELVTESFTAKDPKRLMLAANILAKQGEFQRLPEGSAWLGVARKEAPEHFAWTPPFGFGNEDEFRYGGFVFHFSDDITKRVTYFKFKGNADMFRPAITCSAEAFHLARKESSTLLQGLKGFDRDYNVITSRGERWSLALEVPYQLRVATALLAGIGRLSGRRATWEVVTGKSHYEYSPSEMQPPGIPHVEMPPHYPDVEEDFVLDADRMTAYLEQYFGKKEFERIMDSMGWIFSAKGPDNQPQVNLSAWYGARESLQVLGDEQRATLQGLVKQLSNGGFKLLRQWLFEASIRLPHVNVPLKQLTGQYPTLADLGRFPAEDVVSLHGLMEFSVAALCSTRRVAHLRELYGTKTWTLSRHQFRDIEHSTRIYTSNLLPGKFFLAMVKIIADDHNAQFWKEQSHQSFNDIWHMVNLTVPEKYKKSLEDMRALLSDAKKEISLKQTEKYGFDSEEEFMTMLNTSICSLATSVCVAQRGYCLLDDDNQLQERPPVEIVFLSACAPDFLDPDDRLQARQELQKYFVPPNKSGKWRSHGEYHGRSALMLRIMDIWHRIFTACKDLKVTHPSLLSMGLGIFRPKVAEDDAILLYFEAQLTVLENNENNYGFDTVYLNPGANMKDLLHVLSRKRWRFPFHLQVHGRDAKSLANTLAKEGKRSCILIPADFLAVLQGYVGSWWECGFNERFTGESHIVSTSTAVLARKNVSAIWRGDGVIQMVKCSSSHTNQTVPVCSYVVKGSVRHKELPHVTQPVVMTFAQLVFLDFPQWWGKQPEGEEPECTQQVTALLKRSHWGAIDVATIKVDFLEAKMREVEQASHSGKGYDPVVYASGYLREQLYSKFLDTLCKEPTSKSTRDQQSRRLEDLNAVVIRIDFNLLRQYSFQLGLLISSLVDLRVKSLFHGVIMCACVDAELRALEVRHVMHLGADWVFLYEPIKENYPVQQTFDRFMKDLSRLQRHSPALTQAVYEGRVQVVRKLLVNGADPDHIQPSTGPWAPVHWVHSGHLRDVRGEKKVVLSELRDHKARFELGTLYPRCKVKRGTTAYDMEQGRTAPEPGKAVSKPGHYRLWGLWVTLDAQAGMDMLDSPTASGPGEPPRLVDMDRTPVARLRWMMMNHYSLDMWQVHLSNFACPSNEAWLEWLPNNKEYDDSNSTLLSYLRYIVVEVVAPATTIGVVKWMDTIVSQIINRLHSANHPTDKDDAWKAWIATSVIVHVHNASVLDGDIKTPQLYYRGATPWRGHPDDEPVWITKSFPLSKWRNLPKLGPIDLCITSRELHERLERATVHWLVVTDQAGLQLPIQHYNMAFCMELEKEYGTGLHVVEKGNPTSKNGKNYKIQVNLNLMVEVTIVTNSTKPERATSHIIKVRKVVRMPDHVCVMDNLLETPHLLQEIRSSNTLLFLGAGFSFPARLPGWSQLLVAAADKAAEFVAGQQQPFLVSRDAHVVSEDADHGQVNIKVVNIDTSDEPGRVLSHMTVFREKILSMSEEVKQLVKKPLVENLEMAAQLLEDSLGDVLKWLLKGMLEISRRGEDEEVKLLNGEYILSHSEEYKEMAARLLIVKHLPVSGILTTNYDQLLCFCDEKKRKKNPCSVAKGITPQTKGKKPQYLNMIRNREKQAAPQHVSTDSEDEGFSRPVIQIHGSTSDPQSIVLTREGYRSLLHLNPAYSNFLKTVMARSTLLYMGFSFTDGYFNEIRSELMTLQEKSALAGRAQPFSYAVIDDKPQPVRDFFNHHEGVHLFSWQASKYGYGVMDRYLECLLRCTHLAAALSQCKVLLFNPQTSPLFLTHGQEVEVVNQKSLLNDYLPFDWEDNELFTGHVLKSVNNVPLDDYLLVRLKEPLVDPSKHQPATVYADLLGPAAEGRAFFIPRRYMKSVEGVGELQEDAEVHILVEMLRCQHECEESLCTRSQLGMDLAYMQYLVPFGLKVLDTRCYAVDLDCASGVTKVRLLPHKLLRLKKVDRFDDRSANPQQPVSLDLTGIARRVAEETARMGAGDAVLWANNIQKSLRQVQASYEDSLAQNSKTMDHTMETIAEILDKQEKHPLYKASESNAALKSHFQPFILHSNITALALLKSELVHTNCIKTFIIINAANFTAPPRAHIELFRHLYHSTSPYLQWAYPPRVIVHTGDSNVEKKYEAVFSEYSLWTFWVSYAATVIGVMEEIQKPVSSKSTNLPVAFRGRGSFTTNNYPEFPDTVVVDVVTGEEQSKWPIPPFHTLSLAHVNGRQQESALPLSMCSFLVGRSFNSFTHPQTSRHNSFQRLMSSGDPFPDNHDVDFSQHNLHTS